jgi:hypothetical protein
MWNIGVTVRNRVATLWGPVPSAEVAFRAELCLKAMIELTEVKNDLVLSEHVKPMRVPLKIDNPPSLIPPALPPLLPSTPRSFPAESDSWPAKGTLELRRRAFHPLPATIRFD